MDAYELAGRLSKLPGLGSIRLIALPRDVNNPTAEIPGHGFCHHLIKPVNFAAAETVVDAERAAPLDRPPTHQ